MDEKMKERGERRDGGRGNGGGSTNPCTLPYVSASACTNLQKV